MSYSPGYTGHAGRKDDWTGPFGTRRKLYQEGRRLSHTRHRTRGFKAGLLKRTGCCGQYRVKAYYETNAEIQGKAKALLQN